MNILIRCSLFVIGYAFALSVVRCVADASPDFGVDHFIFLEDNLDDDTEKWTYVSASNMAEDTISLFGVGEKYVFQYGQSKTNDLPVFSLWAPNSPDGASGVFAVQKGRLRFFALVEESFPDKTSLTATSWCMNSESSWGFENTCFGPCKLFASSHGSSVNIFESLGVSGMDVSLACLGDARTLVLRKAQGLECYTHNEMKEMKIPTNFEVESFLRSTITPKVYFQNAPLPVVLEQLTSCFHSARMVFGNPELYVNSSEWTISFPCYFNTGTQPCSLAEFSQTARCDNAFPTISFSKSESSYMSFFGTLAEAAGGSFSINSGSISISGKSKNLPAEQSVQSFK